jgi:D-beta-D-heptose 7-phosphate kinase/D-beta-D-heptose 1-phosphate adenosyltransferase
MRTCADKILPRGGLRRFRQEHAREKIVFTNGCFDILHRGHVEILTKAKSFGDILVVGLNSDASVARLKGASRPFVGEEDRSCVLAAFEAVDYIVVFEEDTPLEVIRELEPDVLVKGAEYEHEKIVGTDIVEARGGRVERVPMRSGYSTTSLLEKIRR